MRFIKSARFSTVGVFFAGIIAVIQGCSLEKEGALFAVLLLILQFCSAPVEETTTGGFIDPAPGKIIMFGAGVQSSGNFKSIGSGTDGREGADKICRSSNTTGRPDANVHALLSVSGADQLKDMPATYFFADDIPIVGPLPSQSPIADQWSKLFTGLGTSLKGAGIVSSGSINFWWSGSRSDGTVDMDTCVGWTSNGTENGRMGDGTKKDFRWINSADAVTCPPGIGPVLEIGSNSKEAEHAKEETPTRRHHQQVEGSRRDAS